MTPEFPEFPRRGGLWLKFLLAACMIVVLSAGVTATVGLNTVQGFVDDLKQGGTIPGASAVISDAAAGDPQTLLLIGSDHRYGDDTRNARSDTMMLVRLDPKADVTTVLSIPRDLKVDFTVPGGGLRVGAKINETYTDGGEVLTARVIGRLLQIPINHIINVDFGGFRAAVDAIGCVYVDADRWYYHSNVGSVEQYAEIDVPPGYQRLCGQRALDYVRFRHLDNDFVRAARQQDFLRQAKSQYGVDQFIADPHKLTSKIGKHMRTDAALQSKEEFLKLALLAGNSLNHPVRQVQFPIAYDNSSAGSFVTATPEVLARVRHEFLAPPPKAEPARRSGGRGRGQGKKRRGPGGPSLDGLVNAQTEGEDYAIQLGAMKFPVYYPKLIVAGRHYAEPARDARGQQMYPRAYRIKAPDGKMKAAYRLVVPYNTIEGDYYGIQGTTWTDPPILRNPSSDTRTINGKKLLLVYDGKRLRTVGWKTSKAAYWVQNTLQARLTNDQMLAIAGSLTRLGGR
ncbi:MAG TPA: LCP family protein [Gemmatimonadaceae bacterium]|nr:LCP family protein [Gemmatimonadaceae bacterium]